jgi:EamA-like transporter family
MRDALFLAVIIVGGTCGEMSITHAMKRVGEVRSFRPGYLAGVLGRAFREGWMWFGLLLMTLGFFALLALLSWENVAFVVPATALSYVVGALGGKWFLGERVTVMRWMGVLLVCMGVVLVWLG